MGEIISEKPIGAPRVSCFLLEVSGSEKECTLEVFLRLLTLRKSTIFLKRTITAVKCLNISTNTAFSPTNSVSKESS